MPTVVLRFSEFAEVAEYGFEDGAHRTFCAGKRLWAVANKEWSIERVRRCQTVAAFDQ